MNQEFLFLHNFELVIFVYKYFRIPANLLKFKGIKNFPVLNFLLTQGSTGRPSKLKKRLRNCEDHRAFVVAIHNKYMESSC